MADVGGHGKRRDGCGCGYNRGMSVAAGEAGGRQPPAQVGALLAAAVAAAGLAWAISAHGADRVALFAIGAGLGVALYRASFGFSGAWRRAIVEGDISGAAAQALMIAAAILLFAPLLASGAAGGALAPVGVSVAFGAFIFGVGMQLAGGCASGTLFSAGGGSVRMVAVLAGFCAGAFAGSLHLGWWRALPGAGPVSLGETLGWPAAIALQLALLAAVVAALRALGGRMKRPLWGRPRLRGLWRGPWPLLLGAAALAALNWLTLLIAGHPWSIVWGFTLWGAKAAAFLGWDPAASAFWAGRAALGRPVLADTTSAMNLGVVLGAFAAAALAGRFRVRPEFAPRAFAAAILGGLIMGYGARLAYGCNIGAFFSGVASSSLHGWLWILAAIPGNLVGVRLRPLFGLDRGS